MPALQILKGNIRFLYSKEATVRDEAITRLLHLITMGTESNSPKYLPNVMHITDTINNNLCILDTPMDIRKSLVFNQYEVGLINLFLILLTNNVPIFMSSLPQYIR